MIDVPTFLTQFVNNTAQKYPGMAVKVGYDEEEDLYIVDIDDILTYYDANFVSLRSKAYDALRVEMPTTFFTTTHPGSLVRIRGPVLYEAKVPLNK